MWWTSSVSQDNIFSFLILGMSNSSPGTYYKYLFLEKMQLPLDYPKPDIYRGWLPNPAAIHRPPYLLWRSNEAQSTCSWSAVVFGLCFWLCCCCYGWRWAKENCFWVSFFVHPMLEGTRIQLFIDRFRHLSELFFSAQRLLQFRNADAQACRLVLTLCSDFNDPHGTAASQLLDMKLRRNKAKYGSIIVVSLLRVNYRGSSGESMLSVFSI